MEERSDERKLTLLNQIERENKRKNEQRYCTLEVTSSCDSDSSIDDNASDLYSVRKRPKNIIDCGLAVALDITKVSDRNATYIAATAKSLGHDLKDIVCNRMSIHRERSKFRKEITEGLKEEFKPTVALIIHWDGKMLCDIMGK